MHEYYRLKVRFESLLDMSLLTQDKRSKDLVKEIYSKLSNDDIWVIKTSNLSLDLRKLVDFLFNNNLDVFDIEYGIVTTKIYVCRKDAYRIQNSVVYALRNTNVNTVHTNP